MFAGEVRYERFGIKSGLPSEEINCVEKDSDGYLWIGTSKGFARYDGYNFVAFNSNTLEGLTDNFVKTIVDLDERTLLIGTYQSGVLLFDKFNFSLTQLPLEFFPQGRNYRYVTCAVKQDSTTVWLGTAGGVLKLFHSDNEWQVKDYSFLLASVKRKNVTAIYLDSSDFLWIATQNEGVVSFNQSKDEIKHYYNYDFGVWNATQSINSIIEIEGKLVLAGYMSLIWLDTEQDEFKLIDLGKSITNITAIYQKGKKVWIGEKDVGLLVFPNGLNYSGSNEYYKHYPVIDGAQSSHVLDYINDLFVDDFGNIWCGTSFSGLVQAKEMPEIFSDIGFENYKSKPIPGIHPNCIYSSNDVVWVGTNRGLFSNLRSGANDNFIGPVVKGGVYQVQHQSDSTFLVASGGDLMALDTRGRIVRRYNYKYEGKQDIIWSICQYDDQFIYFGTYDGAFKLDVKTSELKRIPVDFNKNKVWLIKRDKAGNVWLSAFKSGVAKYNPRTEEVTYFNEKNGALASNEVNALFLDGDSSVWLGTKLGLSYLQDEKFKLLSMPGVPSSEIRSINSGEDRMWLGQRNGVIKFDHNANTFQYFPLLGAASMFRNFMSEGATISKDSSLFFITNDKVRKLTVPALKKVKNEFRISEFFVNNRRLLPNEEYAGRVIIEKDINELDQVTLAYDENNISISLSGLDYLTHDEYFAYKFDDDDWNYLNSGTNIIKYIRLSPGTYNLTIRQYSSNSSVFIAEKELQIVINKHYLLSLPALALYGLVIFLVFYITIYIVRLKQKTILEHERQEQRLNFYTDMSHETRTPLTLVIDSARKLLSEKKFEQVPEIKFIYNNASRLMQLMDRVLELRKIETEYASLDLVKCNVGEIIQNYCATFQNELKQHNLSYSFENNFSSEEVYVDPFKVERIIFNLMSNATKYTPDNGFVNVRIVECVKSGNSNCVKVSITNSGPGILEEDLPNIFNRYYRKSNSQYIKSSGIGLDLTRKLVMLHGGEISVDSRPNDFTTFTFTLCVDMDEMANKGYPVKEMKQFELSKDKLYDISLDSEDRNDKQPRSVVGSYILVVEDNPELLKYMADLLSTIGRVKTATNGEEAYQMIQETKPSLIVSDLMMPVMDGAELCRKVKNDIRYRHIPYILLTASHSEQAKKEVYEAGAEDFVTKPFNSDILLVRIKRLLADSSFISGRIKEWETVKKGIIQGETKASESAFEKRVHKVVIQHISDPEFDVNVLADKMKMGKTSFYNKLKEVTGKAPIEYINHHKLKQAKEDLLTGKYTVSEVAYNLGYNDPSYFARVFKKEFGCTPTQFLKSVGDNDD